MATKLPTHILKGRRFGGERGMPVIFHDGRLYAKDGRELPPDFEQLKERGYCVPSSLRRLIVKAKVDRKMAVKKAEVERQHQEVLSKELARLESMTEEELAKEEQRQASPLDATLDVEDDFDDLEDFDDDE